MSNQRFPLGWDERRVREVLKHYENLTDDEEFAEIEAVHQLAGEALNSRSAIQTALQSISHFA